MLLLLACATPSGDTPGSLGVAHPEAFDAACTAATDGQHDFMLCTPRLSWPDAQAACAAEGWHLADVDDATENTWLQAELALLDAVNPWWFGLNDLDAEGTFAWDGGSSSTYTAWRAGEPNNFGAGEDCVRFPAGSAEWADADCTALAPYACETGCLYESSWSDADGDGLGDAAGELRACGVPAGAVDNTLDCDDTDAAIGEAFPWYADDDGDGYGGAQVDVACVGPTGSVTNALDCDDTSAAIAPGAVDTTGDGIDQDCDGADACTWYRDGDGDGWGVDTETTEACGGAEGYAVRAGDCDDTDAATFPGASEVWYDGVDQGCDGGTDDDQDGDTSPYGTDCDDTDSAISPLAAEDCDAADQDCDGLLDDLADVEGAACDECTPSRSGDHLYLFCDSPSPWATARSTCEGWGYHLADADDAADDAFLSGEALGVDSARAWWIGLNDLATEGTFAWDGGSNTTYTHWRAGEPNNYQGSEDCVRYPAGSGEWADGDCAQSQPFVCEFGCLTESGYTDADGDGAGDPATEVRACTRPAGTIAEAGDCDDTDGSVSPTAAELCRAGDEDCDGLEGDSDPSVSDPTAWYTDGDEDGAGAGAPTYACVAPVGMVAGDGDCDDADPARSPTLPDIAADGIDQDCDGEDSCVWYYDADLDGFGDDARPLPECAGGAGYVAVGGDCDDADATSYPGATEVWYDGVDQDCAGDTDDDQDHDGVPAIEAGGTDCQDLDPLAYPGAAERCNGADDTCDGLVDEAVGEDGGPVEGGACTGCVPERHGDGLYLFCTVGREWVDASADCAAWGYHLLDLGTQSEDVWAWAYATTVDGTRQWWFGLSDLEEEGAFTWSSGAPLTWEHWADGEPNDYDENEDCVRWSASGGGAWSDGDCELRLPYVCEVGCTAYTGWLDEDGDGWGGEATESCAPLTDVVAVGGDCDDGDAAVSPGSVERCDEADTDEDCDGEAEEAGADGESAWYPDVDGDGWGAGTSKEATFACDAPDGFVDQSGDCDDGNAAMNPEAVEAVDGLDNDCDGFDEGDDPDGDGLSTAFELLAGCDPANPDTDGDGRWDAEEAVLESDKPRDQDKDGTPDCADPDRGCGCASGPTAPGLSGLVAAWWARRRLRKSNAAISPATLRAATPPAAPPPPAVAQPPW